MLSAWQHPTTIKPVRVLGIILRGPVTLGQVLLMHEAQSPVVTGERIGLGDLANAVVMCTWCPRIARIMLRSKLRDFAMKVWARVSFKFTSGSDCDRFCDWFTAHCAAPVAWRKGTGSGKEAAAPWPIQALARAMSELGMSRNEAEETSVLEINQLIGASIEARGEIEFKTDREQRVIEWLKHNEVSTRN